MTMPLALPDPAELVRLDQVDGLAEQLEAAVLALDDMNDLAEVRVVVAKGDGLAVALRKVGASRGLVRKASLTARYAEARMGELLGPPMTPTEKGSLGGRGKLSGKPDNFPERQRVEELRRLALAKAAGLLATLAQESPSTPISRDRILRLFAELEEERKRRDERQRQREARRAARSSSVEEVEPEPETSVDVIVGDFREVKLDEPADAIVTDPPYPDEFLPLWSDLGEWAFDNLRSGGVLIAWTGQIRLIDVGSRLVASPLRYGWTFALLLPGANSRIHIAPVVQTWKPIFVFVKDRWPSHGWGPDSVTSPVRSKSRYGWEQNVEPAVELIERLTPEGGLVVDPMCGVGSFGVAASRAGRDFVGIELDEGRALQARQRLGVSE